ncbi:DUF4410 domain-containing protein [Myxococcota bacterium]|nr:DUF4410 domain-containing protein [Myxococcota bacterium]
MGLGERWSGEIRSLVSIGVLLLLVAGGCASIKISDREEYAGGKLARPDRIFVHDFAASAGDLPSWSEAARTYSGKQAASSSEELSAARTLGVHMGAELVRRIDAMGLEAERADFATKPAPGDLVIVGFLGSVEEGSGFKRVVVGFGAGSAEVTSHVEGYLATEDGYRKLGSGDASSRKRRTPGVVVPLAVTIATANPIGLLVMTPIKVGTEMSGRNKIEGVGKRMAGEVADALEAKFREQGWIAP